MVQPKSKSASSPWLNAVSAWPRILFPRPETITAGNEQEGYSLDCIQNPLVFPPYNHGFSPSCCLLARYSVTSKYKKYDNFRVNRGFITITIPDKKLVQCHDKCMQGCTCCCYWPFTRIWSFPNISYVDFFLDLNNSGTHRAMQSMERLILLGTRFNEPRWKWVIRLGDLFARDPTRTQNTVGRVTCLSCIDIPTASTFKNGRISSKLQKQIQHSGFGQLSGCS